MPFHMYTGETVESASTGGVAQEHVVPLVLQLCGDERDDSGYMFVTSQAVLT